jgi:hypothetical protein
MATPRSKESTVDLATIADPWAEATLAATKGAYAWIGYKILKKLAC